MGWVVAHDEALGFDLGLVELLPLALAQGTHSLVDVGIVLGRAPLPNHVNDGFTHDDLGL